MNNSPIITTEEWDRIRQYIEDGPATTYLDTSAEGTMVVFAGGVMHPRAYLQVMEDDDDDAGPVDILKHVPAADPNSPIGIMPSSLRGASVAPWKPRKDGGI
jgi:hypothetical protein